VVEQALQDTYGSAVAIDSKGNVVVGGYSTGSIGSPTNGDEDQYLIKYDPFGAVVWSTQYGAIESDVNKFAVVDEADNIYSGGSCGDIFYLLNAQGVDMCVFKTDPSGNLLGKVQIGGSGTDVALGAVATSTSLFVVGKTQSPSFGGQALVGSEDAILLKYDPATLTLQDQYHLSTLSGGASVQFRAVAVNSKGELWVVGTASGNVGASTSSGGFDMLANKVSASLQSLFIAQDGFLDNDVANAVTVDPQDNVYICGSSDSAQVNGVSSNGDKDVLLIKRDDAGTVLWTVLLGGTGADSGAGVAFDAERNVLYVSGSTSSASFYGTATTGVSSSFLLAVDPATGAVLNAMVSSFTSAESTFSNSALAVRGSTLVTVGSNWRTVGGLTVSGSTDALVTVAALAPKPPLSELVGQSSKLTVGASVALDTTGGAALSGTSTGSIGGPSAGGNDQYVHKYDASGVIEWSTQFGGPGNDVNTFVVQDAARNTYAGGSCTGAVISSSAGGDKDWCFVKLDVRGRQVGGVQIGGTAGDQIQAAATDATSLYVVGYTQSPMFDGVPALGFVDAVLLKYDLATLSLQNQYRQGVFTGTLQFRAVAVNSKGELWLVGQADRPLDNGIAHGHGHMDVLVNKVAANFTSLYLAEDGDFGVDWGTAVAIDPQDNVYICGSTASNIVNGVTTSGVQDVLLIKRDDSGAVLFTAVLGGDGVETGTGVAFDAARNVLLVSGTTTSASLYGTAATGASSAFLLEVDPATGAVLKSFVYSSTTAGATVTSSSLALRGSTVAMAGSTTGAFHGQAALGTSDAALLVLAAQNPELVPATEAPTVEPSGAPTVVPTMFPTFDPTMSPTTEPTVAPSADASGPVGCVNASSQGMPRVEASRGGMSSGAGVGLFFGGFFAGLLVAGAVFLLGKDMHLFGSPGQQTSKQFAYTTAGKR